MWESSRLFRSALSTTSSPGTFFADTPRPAAPAGVQRLQGKPSLKMAHVCTRSNAFFSRNPLPRPAVSRSAAYSNRANLVRVSAQNGELFFVTNNIFKVKQEGCQQFEETWKNRVSRLKDTPGFLRFVLLRGDEEGEYISQTTWASRQAFKDWTQSQNFAKAHGTSQGEQDKKPEHGSKRAGMAELLDGPPKPRFYEAVTVTEL